MDERDPGAPLDMGIGESTMRYDDFSHPTFVQKLHLQILPNDREHREGFDVPSTFRLGDPNVHFHAAAAKSYETSGATGKPEWDSLFGYILARMSHLRFMSTVYVLVDDRDLTNLDNPEPSLQHWPAVAAWWSSRACMMGPAQERFVKRVVYIRYTPPGLAPLCLRLSAWSFRGSTLCYLIVIVYRSATATPCIAGEATTSSCAGEMNLDPPGQVRDPLIPKKQGVVLVTEHNAEVNAGFVVLRGSHPDLVLSRHGD